MRRGMHSPSATHLSSVQHLRVCAAHHHLLLGSGEEMRCLEVLSIAIFPAPGSQFTIKNAIKPYCGGVKSSLPIVHFAERRRMMTFFAGPLFSLPERNAWIAFFAFARNGEGVA